MTYDLMQYIEEEEQAAGGGGMFVCQAELAIGYLVYATGPRVDRYFKVMGGDDRDEQKAAAKALGEKLGGIRSQFCVSLSLFADSVLNREETPTWTQAGPWVWAHDLPVYTDAWREVLSPSIQSNFGEEIPFNEKFWAQINLVPDPYNKKSGKDNNVPMLVQVFETKEQAIEALGEENTFGTNLPDQPETWNEGALGVWKIQVEDIIKHFKENPKDDGEFFLMPQFGVDKDMLEQLRGIAQEEEMPF